MGAFYNSLVISLGLFSLLVETRATTMKPIDLPQVIKLSLLHVAKGGKRIVVIGTDCTGKCKYIYNTMTIVSFNSKTIGVLVEQELLTIRKHMSSTRALFADVCL